MTARTKPGKIGAVVAQLGVEIAGGVLAPDSVLPAEPLLEARFGASRGVIREAVKVLAAKGMVSVGPRHGTRVRPRHDWSWLDRDLIGWLSIGGMDRGVLVAYQEMRRAIEPMAAELAARRSAPDERRAVMAAYRAMVADAGDPAKAIAADRRFHLRVLDATGNPVLQSLRGTVEAVLDLMFDMTVDVFHGNLESHGAVAEAIERGDPAGARSAMEALLRYTETFLTESRTSPRPSSPSFRP